MNITLVGAGSLGCHLARVLFEKGFNLNQIITRNPIVGEQLSKETGAIYAADITDLHREVDCVILTVPDQPLADLASRIPDGDYFLVHTSGSTPLEAILKSGKQGGVLYPLQSFTMKRMPDWSAIPIFVEGSSPDVEKKLISVANLIGKSAHLLDSPSRSRLHLAAVFASNFTNHLLDLAEGILDSSGLPPRVLSALVKETVDKALELGAYEAQSGPAKRGDWNTVKMHLELLSYEGFEKKIYELLSQSIHQRHNAD